MSKIILNNSDFLRVISFVLIIFQSIGIRFYDGQGFFLSLLIILLNFKNLKLITRREISILALICSLILLIFFLNENFSVKYLTYELSLIFSCYLFLLSYKNKYNIIILDFYLVCRIFVYHALLGYLIYILFPFLYIKEIGLNLSFYNIFFVSNSSFLNFQRNTGVFWEPGVFQIIANYYLFYSIKFKFKGLKLLLPFLAVVSSFSTTGFLILFLNIIYFIYINSKISNKSIIAIPIIIIVIFSFLPLFLNNTTDKFSDSNTSGLIRQRDMLIGISMIKDKPFLGHGLFASDYLIKNSTTLKVEKNIFDYNFINSTNLAGGYTNGLLGFVMAFGIPVSIFVFFFFFKNKLIDRNGIERFTFSLIFLLSLLSSPISLTSFFLLFPLSYIILSNKNKKSLSIKNENINYHSNLQ